MQIKLYASLRQTAGTKMVDMDFHLGLTLREVMAEITRRYPSLGKVVWTDQHELTELIHIFVNGENFHHLAGLDTILAPEDKVDIFPPLVGGI